MKPYTLFLLIVAICASTSSIAQDALITRFGNEAIASIEGTEKHNFLIFQNANGFVVQDLSTHKDISGLPDALQVEPLSEAFPALTADSFEGDFQLFGYDFPVHHTDEQYYRIGNTGKVFIVLPSSTTRQLFQNQIQNAGTE
jgi:hypothetical protein